jgi:hypothetical protein
VTEVRFRNQYTVWDLLIPENLTYGFDYGGPHQNLVQLRPPTAKEHALGHKQQHAVCTSFLRMPLSTKNQAVFADIAANKILSAESMEGGSYPGPDGARIRIPGLAAFPAPFRSLLDDARRELKEFAKRTVSVLRWRAGMLQWKDLTVPGAHPPLITLALFEQVQAATRQRYWNPGVRGTVEGFPLRGIAICAECRGRMTAERHERWGYYRCGRNAFKSQACRAKFCNEKRAHADLERICQQVRLTRPTAAAIMDRVKRLLDQRTANRTEVGKRLEEEEPRLLRTEMDSPPLDLPTVPDMGLYRRSVAVDLHGVGCLADGLGRKLSTRRALDHIGFIISTFSVWPTIGHPQPL